MKQYSYLIECVVVLGKVEDIKQSDGLLQLLGVVHVEVLTALQELTIIVLVDKVFDSPRVLKNKRCYYIERGSLHSKWSRRNADLTVNLL